ncbi:MAG: SHOCT domain-containing protein [Erysipelothrix sp.]|nr:SHOCT domain-containing protein [Erysipelothrix sp.]
MFIGLGIIVLIVALVVWVVLKKKKDNDPILLSLKEKFVRGEITEEEYLSKKRTLNLK